MNDDGQMGEAEHLKKQVLTVLAALHPKTPDQLMDGPNGEKLLSEEDKALLKPHIDQAIVDLRNANGSPFAGQNESVISQKFEQTMQWFLREYRQNQFKELGHLESQVSLVLAALHPKTPDQLMDGPNGEKLLSDEDKEVLKPMIAQVVSNLCELESSPFYWQNKDVVSKKFERSMQVFLRDYTQNQIRIVESAWAQESRSRQVPEDGFVKLLNEMKQAGYLKNENESLRNAAVLIMNEWGPKIFSVLTQGSDGKKRLSNNDKKRLVQFIGQTVESSIDTEGPSSRSEEEVSKFKESIQLFIRGYIQDQLNAAASESKEEIRSLTKDFRMLDSHPSKTLYELMKETTRSASEIEADELKPLKKRIQLLADEKWSAESGDEHSNAQLSESNLQTLQRKTGLTNINVETWAPQSYPIDEGGIVQITDDDQFAIIYFSGAAPWFAAVPVDRIVGFNLELVQDQLANGEATGPYDVLSIQQAIQNLESLRVPLTKKIESLSNAATLLQAIGTNKSNQDRVEPWLLGPVQEHLIAAGPLNDLQESILAHLPSIWRALRFSDKDMEEMRQFVNSCVDAHKRTYKEIIAAAGQEPIGPTQQAESFSDLSARVFGFHDERAEVRALAKSVFKASAEVIDSALGRGKSGMSIEDAAITLSESITKAFSQMHLPTGGALTIDSTQDLSDPKLFAHTSTSSIENVRDKFKEELQREFEKVLITTLMGIARDHEEALAEIVQRIQMMSDDSHAPWVLNALRDNLRKKMPGKLEIIKVMGKQYQDMMSRPPVLITGTHAEASDQSESVKGKGTLRQQAADDLEEHARFVMETVAHLEVWDNLLKAIFENRTSDSPSNTFSLQGTQEFIDYHVESQEKLVAKALQMAPRVAQALQLGDESYLRGLQSFFKDTYRTIQIRALENAKNTPLPPRIEIRPRSGFEGELIALSSFGDKSPDLSTKPRALSDMVPKAIEYSIDFKFGDESNELKQFAQEVSEQDKFFLRQRSRSKEPEIRLWSSELAIPEGGISYITNNDKWVIVIRQVTVAELEATDSELSLRRETTPLPSTFEALRSDSRSGTESDSDSASIGSYVAHEEFYVLPTRWIPNLDLEDTHEKLETGVPVASHEVSQTLIDEPSTSMQVALTTATKRQHELFTVKLTDKTTVQCHPVRGGETVHTPIGRSAESEAIVARAQNSSTGGSDRFVLIHHDELQGGLDDYIKLLSKIGERVSGDFRVKSKEELEALRRAKQRNQSSKESVGLKQSSSEKGKQPMRPEGSTSQSGIDRTAPSAKSSADEPDSLAEVERADSPMSGHDVGAPRPLGRGSSSARQPIQSKGRRVSSSPRVNVGPLPQADVREAEQLAQSIRGGATFVTLRTPRPGETLNFRDMMYLGQGLDGTWSNKFFAKFDSDTNSWRRCCLPQALQTQMQDAVRRLPLGYLRVGEKISFSLNAPVHHSERGRGGHRR